jgi:uracil-DNA glycosylase family 4
MNIYVPASGCASAKLMLLGEAPSYAEEQALQPFVGPAGRELDRILKAANINRSDLWISNVSKYMVPFSNEHKKASFQTRCQEAGINLQEQIDDLRREIQAINPNVILALGNTALHALTGKQPLRDYRGSILSTWLGKKLVASYHPAHFLHQEKSESAAYWERQVAIFDFKRALTQSQFPEIQLPSRNLHIARNSADVYDFIHSANSNKLSIDIEADNCIPICIGLAFNKHEGITIPLWTGLSDSDIAATWMLLARVLVNKEIKKVGQNFKYDQDKITRLGLPIDALHSDTMLKAFCINPELPKNLAFNTSIYTEEPFYKNEGMYAGTRDDLLVGCARDACVTWEVDDMMEVDIEEMGLNDYYHNFIMHLHNLYLHIENNGFMVDTEKREALLKKYIAWDEKLRFELFCHTNEYINVNSWKQVGKLLYDKLAIPYRRGTGEEILTGLLNNVVKDASKKAVIENILESRRVRKTISNNLAALRDFDGKMRTSYFICLDTGRSSTGQQEPPIRPSIEIIEIDDTGKRKKKKKSIGSPFQTLTKHGEIGPDVRSMYVPENGHIFLQADSSQAEARVIFLLAEDYEALRDIDEHDYHALTASWFFGGNESDYSKKILGYESPIRFAGKAQPLDAKILTPNGWKLMQDIKVGDEICDSMYKTCLVTEIFPQGIKEVFKITLSDKSEAESCKEHLWQIQSIWDRQRGIVQIKKLEDIMKLKFKNSRGNPNYSIQRQNAMWFNYQSIPINPYILGVMLGDGSFRTPYGCSFFTDDEEILQQFIIEFGYEKLSNPSDRTYYISDLRPIINNLGLSEKYSHEKFIPEIYKINSLENRLEILRGLMDTDGTINEFGSAIEFSTSSEQLANDVIFLVRSLGGIANMTDRIPKYEYKGEIREGKKSYRVFINIRQLNPFKLTRKAERWERWDKKTRYDLARNIISIEKSREVECQCISVNSEDHLYVTDDFILTHNTLRHAGHLGAGKRRAAIETNTQARKYKINFTISEAQAGRALDIFHKKQPKIKQVFQASVIEVIKRTRKLVAPVPYGIDAKVGGTRIFYERESDELFRQAFSYLPQRTVSENTKAAALRIRKRANWIQILVESHDALLVSVPIENIQEASSILTEEFTRPIDFSTCSIPRGKLIIPCEIESGMNYYDMSKFKWEAPIGINT